MRGEEKGGRGRARIGSTRVLRCSRGYEVSFQEPSKECVTIYIYINGGFYVILILYDSFIIVTISTSFLLYSHLGPGRPRTRSDLALISPGIHWKHMYGLEKRDRQHFSSNHRPRQCTLLFDDAPNTIQAEENQPLTKRRQSTTLSLFFSQFFAV